MQSTLKHIFILVIFLLLSISSIAQRYAISGYVADAKSKETLVGATIIEQETGRGVVTDLYGYFQFVGLTKGKHKFIVSYIGYQPFEMEVKLESKSKVLPDILLEPRTLGLDEVSIVAASPDVAADRQVETSMIELSAKAIQSIPTAGNDVFSAIKYLPGIDRTEPFSPLYTVRGGEPGENAVLLDGVMIYNPYHASISSGIFNTQIIKSVDMLVGGFGAEYGGRNSSVMYITSKDGNQDKLHGEIEPSTFQSKVFLEFPVGERGSGVVSGRYFYDMFSEFIMQSRSYFYDFNLSYTNRINSRNRLTFKYFQSHDRSNVDMNTFFKVIDNTVGINFYEEFDFQLTSNWTNKAGTFIHKWVAGPRIFIRSQVYYSQHSSKNYSGFEYEVPEVLNGDTVDVNLKWKASSNFINQISDVSAKSQLNYKILPQSTFVLGGEWNQYAFRNSADIQEINQGELVRDPVQWSFFAANKLELGPVILRPGVRAANYDNTGWLYEPRVNMVIKFPARLKFKAAWGTYYQYVISLNTNEVEMNQAVDYYYPLHDYKPSKSIHYIAGLEHQLTPQANLSLDVYYKDILRVYTFDINQLDADVITLSEKLQKGSGNAWGAELMLRGAYKNLSGWASYGLSWANRSYPFINNGEEYPYDYNRRHTIKLVANYAITKNLEYNTSFTLLSGTYRSIERISQDYYYYDPQSREFGQFPLWFAPQKNNAKMPPVMNLDISIKKRLRSGFGKQLSDVFNASESYLMVTIRNLTFFRRNVDYYFPVSLPRWKDKYLPVGTNYLPSVGLSYTIKF